MASSFEAELNPGIAGLYHATRAALDFSLQRNLAEGNQAKGNTNRNFDFSRGNIVRQEPQRFQANRNAANSAGLAESGVLAQTQQRQAANFNQQLAGLSQQRAQAVQRITSGEQFATGAHAVGLEQAGAQAKKEQMEYDIANARPAEAVAAAPTPAALKAKAAKKSLGKLEYTGGYGKAPGYRMPGYG